MSLPEFHLLRPKTLREALGELARHAGEIQIIAGGTDLVPSLQQKLFSPRFLLDIRGIDELKRIRVVAGSGVEIGALVTLSAIEDSEFIRRNYSVLHQAAQTVASPI